MFHLLQLAISLLHLYTELLNLHSNLLQLEFVSLFPLVLVCIVIFAHSKLPLLQLIQQNSFLEAFCCFPLKFAFDLLLPLQLSNRLFSFLVLVSCFLLNFFQPLVLSLNLYHNQLFFPTYNISIKSQQCLMKKVKHLNKLHLQLCKVQPFSFLIDFLFYHILLVLCLCPHRLPQYLLPFLQLDFLNHYIDFRTR